ASFSSTGLTIRHGPHHGAHRSTRTGSVASSATAAKSSSVASTIHGSGWWQLLQRATPRAAFGTRFLRPQFGQTTTLAGDTTSTDSSVTMDPVRATHAVA